MECSEADVADLTQPATTRHLLHLPQSRHCPAEVIWDIDVVILTANIPSDLK